MMPHESILHESKSESKEDASYNWIVQTVRMHSNILKFSTERHNIDYNDGDGNHNTRDNFTLFQFRQNSRRNVFFIVFCQHGNKCDLFKCSINFSK